MKNRSTADMVILAFTFVIAFEIVTVTVVAVVGLSLGHTEIVREMFEQVGKLTASLIALVVGYIAGRGRKDGPEDR